jgi:Family of unknown function (DUF6502)
MTETLRPTRRRRPATTAAVAGTATTPSAPQPAPLDLEALGHAIRQLAEPLATLAIASGMPFVVIEETLKTAFVDAARRAHPGLPAHRMVSRISTVTGLNRREVTRISETPLDAAAAKRSPANRVFAKWLTEPALKGAQGEPRALPRQGPAPSFESLARSVTQDVHPRSLLDEMCRLGLARVDDDTVYIDANSFVPRGDPTRMLGFLGQNVGDHLRAAVANVLIDPPAHHEQAIFADELSAASIDEFRSVVRAQWKLLLDATVPALQRLIDADRAAGRPQDHRVRLGLYSFNDRMTDAPESVGQRQRIPPRPRAPKKTRER